MKDIRCINCGNPKAMHSLRDEFCLTMNGWTAEDFVDVIPAIFNRVEVDNSPTFESRKSG